MHGAFGGAVELTTDFEHNPLVVQAGGQSLAVISTAATVDFGLAATYDRYRVYANFTMPTNLTGNSGTVDGYTYTTPDITLGSDPDSVGDIRLGFDARLLGDARSPFRLGAGAQLYIPNDLRANYDTDGTFRAMGRLLFAGDKGIFTYAGQTGVHIRPLNDSPIPGSPQGSEFLFGIAGGVKIPIRLASQLVVGSEIYGALAFQSFMQPAETDKEWLISTRFEGTGNSGRQGAREIGCGARNQPEIWSADMAGCIGGRVIRMGEMTTNSNFLTIRPDPVGLTSQNSILPAEAGARTPTMSLSVSFKLTVHPM
jgi:hypothetical protein